LHLLYDIQHLTNGSNELCHVGAVAISTAKGSTSTEWSATAEWSTTTSSSTGEGTLTRISRTQSFQMAVKVFTWRVTRFNSWSSARTSLISPAFSSTLLSVTIGEAF
jgi:hypothetical protein